ncbi:HECT-type E3 ubiquitin transferase [Aspergillus ibericus CBS 121593]|uniref:Ubiquitin-conjugating enzyme E2-binding protein n=1 Tax=Aspergillus ibericus CBS 121593 TaxID=1448316 RepID=A0A395GQ66_9EURO|nr:hypothetical protein BO80DRAFT_367056 [Aspergillus ibericus CBS 121593]RAK96193.1 hypothetical protein BO80DRAFT_367056 [Aspergillus ibericus CBS 121593]
MASSSTPPPESDPNSSLHLHAELLPNIRQLTLYISVPANTPSTDLTITLSESRRSISVSLNPDNDPITMKLPAHVHPTSHHILHLTPTTLPQTQPRATQGEYSFRMPVDVNTPITNNHNDLDSLDGYIPWTATDMSSATRLRCLKCESEVLGEGKVWKDLPSGNWAEMMDFWHCHKPDPPKGENNGNGDGEEMNAVKGYGAANQVVATPGTVLVDVVGFLVAGRDCLGIPNTNTDTTHPDANADKIHCTTCTTQLGIHDPIANGHRLYKTRLAASSPSSPSPTSSSSPEVSPTTTTIWSHHPPETVISAQLLELIDRESTRRFILHSDNKSGLLIWIFTPTLTYSNASATHQISAQRAMKVFYQILSDEKEIQRMLDAEVGKVGVVAVEEVRLLGEEVDGFQRVLEKSRSLLPVEAREWRGWRVGLVGRFERNISITT